MAAIKFSVINVSPRNNNEECDLSSTLYMYLSSGLWKEGFGLRERREKENGG